MDFYFTVLLLLLDIIQYENHFILADVPCAPKSSLSSHIRIMTENKIEVSTLLQSLLRKGETVCYDLQIPNPDITDSKPLMLNHLLLKITLEDVWQEYEIKKDYNFTTPAIDVLCSCDCPGGSDPCNKNFETERNCDKHDVNKRGFCFQQYSYGHSSTGCFFPFDSAETCCSVSIYKKYPTDIYRAFYLASPKIYFKLRTVLTDHDGGVVNISSCIVSPENGQQIVGENGCNVILESSGQAITNLPNSMWVYHNPLHSNLMVNVRLNDVTETDLHKFGWFKIFPDPNYIFPIRLNDARRALHITMDNCGHDIYYWTFDAVGYKKPKGNVLTLTDIEFGKPIEKYYQSIIKEVITKYRSVIVYPKATSPITIHATLNFPADVVIYHTLGRFDSFRSSIHLDQIGNKILELELTNAFGSLFVSVGDGTNCSVEKHAFTVTKQGVSIKKSFKISHCFSGNQKICVYTFNTETKNCSTALYAEEYFTIPHRSTPSAVKGGKLSVSPTADWFKSIIDWFENLLSNWKFGLIAVGIFIIFIIIVCLLRGPVMYMLEYLCRHRRRQRYQIVSVITSH